MNNKKTYIDSLQGVIFEYNNTIHSTTKEKPANITKLNSDKYKHIYLPKTKNTSKFKVGDTVTVATNKKLFEKGYKKRWTDEIFIISGIKFLDPTEYL